MLDKLDKLESEAISEIKNVQNDESLETWRIAFLINIKCGPPNFT